MASEQDEAGEFEQNVPEETWKRCSSEVRQFGVKSQRMNLVYN